MNNPIEEANKLREEAKMLLKGILNIPPGLIMPNIDRFLDCIIGASILESGVMVSGIFAGMMEAKEVEKDDNN